MDRENQCRREHSQEQQRQYRATAIRVLKCPRPVFSRAEAIDTTPAFDRNGTAGRRNVLYLRQKVCSNDGIRTEKKLHALMRDNTLNKNKKKSPVQKQNEKKRQWAQRESANVDQAIACTLYARHPPIHTHSLQIIAAIGTRISVPGEGTPSC